MLKPKFTKLTNQMSGRMYLWLINRDLNGYIPCLNCTVNNGDCCNIARNRLCKAMRKEINDLLVFHTGEYEFAITRKALTNILEDNKNSPDCTLAGKDVNAVLEEFYMDSEYGDKNVVAIEVLSMLSKDDILVELYDKK